MIDLPLHIVGFVSWCATWLVALIVVARGGARRLSIAALAATYLLLGFAAVLAIGSVSRQHYSYIDVMVNGELLPADDEWLLWHGGVSVGYAALVSRSRTWPLGSPLSSAWFVLVPMVAELLLRPRRWEWLLLSEPSSRHAAATMAPVLFAAILTMALARWRAVASETRGA